MCDLKGPLRFCTCDNQIDLSQPHWRLYTKCTSVKYDLNKEVLGKISNTYWTSKDLERRLNSENLFDFDYVPSENDKLVVYTAERNKLSLIFTEGAWEVEKLLGFQVDREYNTEKKGILKTN